VTCRELLAFLADYLAARLPPAERAELDRHLRLCPACVAYLNNYTTVMALAKRVSQDPEGSLPPAVPEELVTAVLASR
jgi:anti-sigma factor RsiW